MKMLIVFHDMIADMKTIKNISPAVTELFLRGKKHNISLAFTSQIYFKVPKTVRLNATHCFDAKMSKKREDQQIALNHLPDTEFEDFAKLYSEYTKQSFSFLVNGTTLPSENLLRCRKKL